MRALNSRLSISSCFSPMPFTLPPACLSRCDHMRVSLGNWYVHWASSTCRRNGHLHQALAATLHVSRARTEGCLLFFVFITVCSVQFVSFSCQANPLPPPPPHPTHIPLLSLPKGGRTIHV